MDQLELDLVALEKDMRTTKAEIDRLTKIYNSQKAQITTYHNLPYSQTYGGIQVQVIQPSIELELDTERLMKEQPQVFKQYAKVVYKPATTKVVLAKIKESK